MKGQGARGERRGVRGERREARGLWFGLIALLVFLFPGVAQAEEVRAFVDRDQVTLGESLQLTVTVSAGEGEVDVSPIRDFKVISRGTSTSVQIVNGQMSRETRYNYALIPLREGRLRVPRLTIVSDGKRYQTQEITVQVSKQPQTRGNARDVFVEAHVSKQTPYEGEQVVYTFRLYHAVQIANAKYQRPDFSGFTAKEAGDNKTYKATISGRDYQVTEVTYLLMPLNAGEKTIEPAVLNCDIVHRQKNRRGALFDSFFDDPFFGGRARLEAKAFRTKPLTVNVRPLPEYDGDTKFSGLVGKFDVRADLKANTLNVGDSTTLSIVIQGTGNIMDAESPEINLPDAFKVYADNPEEEIRMGKKGYSGKKTFRVALVPVKEGTFALEPIRFSYFDVSKGRYETRSTRPFSFTVHPSLEKDEFEVVSAPSQELRSLKRKVEFTGRDILPLKEELDAVEKQSALSLPGFIFFLVIPGLLCAGAKSVLVLTRKSDDPASIMAERAGKALKDACSSAMSGEEFFSCLHLTLVSIILSKAGTKGESLTYAEAETLLRANGYSQDIAKQAAMLLEKIESAQYGGRSMDESFKESLLSETKQLLRSLA